MEKPDLSARLESLSSIDDIRAVAPGEQVAGADLQGAATIAAASGTDAKDAEAFEKAGWTFVKSAPVGVSTSRGVVVDADGHLKIVSDALNVKFDPALSRAAVEGILDSHALSIRRDMGFAPNLFLVTGGGNDPVAKAQSLNQRDDVVYAEPVLIEPMSSR